MKFCIFVMVAAVFADVSHLNGANGYNYERPQYALNVPAPNHSEQLFESIHSAPSREYLPASIEQHNAQEHYHSPEQDNFFSEHHHAFAQQSNEYLPPTHHEYHAPSPEYHDPQDASAAEYRVTEPEYNAPAPATEYQSQPLQFEAPEHNQSDPSDNYLPPSSGLQEHPGNAPALEYHALSPQSELHAIAPQPQYHAPAHEYHDPAPEYVAPAPVPFPEYHAHEESSVPATETGGYQYRTVKRYRMRFRQ